MHQKPTQLNIQKVRKPRPTLTCERPLPKVTTMQPISPVEVKFGTDLSPCNLDTCEETVLELSTVESSAKLVTLNESASSLAQMGLRFLPPQVERKIKHAGGKLNLMVVGRPGCGKKTFINTLFGTDLLPVIGKSPVGTTMDHYEIKVRENRFDLGLTIFGAPHYAASIDNLFAWLPIKSFIESQYRLYLFQSEQPDRLMRSDTRVHCCLYFISPSATSRMSPLDIVALKELSTCVNIIPVIPKCDTIDKIGLESFKNMIRQTLIDNSIQACDLIENNDYPTDHPLRKPIASFVPFAVIGSNERHYNHHGDLVRGRKYKWGLAEVENDDHCDFMQMRHLLMGEYLLDLVETTETFYLKYRQDCLQARWEAASENKDVDKLNGIAQYFRYTRVSHRDMDAPTSVSKAIFDEKVRQLNVKRDEIIASYERRFKSWRRALVLKQTTLNQDVEREHQRMIDLEADVRELHLLRRNASEARLSTADRNENGDEFELVEPKKLATLQRFATTL